MSTFELIGFAVVLLCTATGAATILIAAGYGFHVLQQQWKRGTQWDQTEFEVRGAVIKE